MTSLPSHLSKTIACCTRCSAHRLEAALAVALLLGGIACGGSSKSAESASGAGKSETLWKDKTHEQRMDWMGLHVFPKMKGAFGQFDADRFSNFACQTCHGDDMEIVDFKMPNKHLYALPRTDTLKSARDYDAKVTDFMLGTVTPTMAELLDTQPYDPATKAGFSCFGCHPVEGE
jgi:hypothetical protein